MGVFEMHARGPLFEEFNEKLQAECEKHWRSGRQMCEVLSLTGNPCTNPIHRGGSEGAGGGEQTEQRENDKCVIQGKRFIISHYLLCNLNIILYHFTVTYQLGNIVAEFDTSVLVIVVVVRVQGRIHSV